MMKGAVVLIMVLAVAFIGLAFYVVTDAGESKHVEDAWDDNDDTSSSSDWGTEVEIEYEDGTNETLNSILDPLKITYGGKDVSKFTYKLSAQGSSDALTTCSLDLTSFWVEGIATSDGVTEWSSAVEYGTIGDLNLDNTWYVIYSLEVVADDLEDSLADGSYKLEFNPSGSIRYRADSSSDWVDIENIPSDCWLSFDKEGFWIEIILEGGFE